VTEREIDRERKNPEININIKKVKRERQNIKKHKGRQNRKTHKHKERQNRKTHEKIERQTDTYIVDERHICKHKERQNIKKHMERQTERLTWWTNVQNAFYSFPSFQL
jgi:hypothetical protein